MRTSVVLIWKDLGRHLFGSNYAGHVDVIESDSPKNVQECCTKMFEYWLQVDLTATWDKLITALEYLGLNNLSERIKMDVLKSTYSKLTKQVLLFILV